MAHAVPAHPRARRSSSGGFVTITAGDDSSDTTENAGWSFNDAINGFRWLFDTGAYREESPSAAATAHYNDPESGQRMIAPVVKNTFINYDHQSPLQSRCWKSSPDRLLCKSFHSKQPKMEVSHWQGTCNPCAYHLYKEDGCRMGDACRFCHLCKEGEVKRRKREKARQKKQEMRVQASSAESSACPLPVGRVTRAAEDALPSMPLVAGPLGSRASVMQLASQPQAANDDYDWRDFEAIFKQARDAPENASANSTQTSQRSLTQTYNSLDSTRATSTTSIDSNPYHQSLWQQPRDFSRRRLSPSRIRQQR